MQEGRETRTSGRSPSRRSRPPRSPFTPDDLYLFNEGRHFRLYEKMGAHATREAGKAGTRFSVWAPDARSVSVVGDFNDWDPQRHPLSPVEVSGIWTAFVPQAAPGHRYKYRLVPRHGDFALLKADPFAFETEIPPKTASVIPKRLAYRWKDGEWMAKRRDFDYTREPLSIYEVHLGSFRRKGPRGEEPLTYLELAEILPAYVRDMGFTHVEFMPVMEHPFYGSWGYQTTAYFAPTARYGTPDELRFLIDKLHQHGIGVILDWVPSHFPFDEHGLAHFDGTSLFEHADPRKGFHPDWHSAIFNYGRHEVRSFLISSAFFWLERFHADGLRVDAVASMLYLDYSRRPGDWLPNPRGGRENLEAIHFLRELTQAIRNAYPGVLTIAEESTAWPGVTRKPEEAGEFALGFDLKWDMGWMHDTLRYLARDPIHRRFHQQELSFRMLYAYDERFILPLSHDEVVHGKGSLFGRMPGDDWQRLANLRALYAYMFAMPGKKLLFMGDEIGQREEWSHERSVDWHLLEDERHAGIQRLVRDLNELYRSEKALHAKDFEREGFEWIDSQDANASVYSFLRKAGDELILCVLNLTPVVRSNYRIGVPKSGWWRELLNTDSHYYGGSGQGNLGALDADPVPMHGRPNSLNMLLPPLAALYLKHEGATRR